MRPRLDRKWVYVGSVSVLFAGTAFLLTLLSVRHNPLAAADAARAQGRYPEALDRYQDVLSRDPGNAAALWGVAETHLARRDPAMAIEYLNRYLQADPHGKHAEDARRALEQTRGSLIADRTPSPELSPGPSPALPAGPSPQFVSQWQQALDLERRGDLLNAITLYAGLAQNTQDTSVRAACLERIARCEARRPPFDFARIRHFYLEAARAYRELSDWQNSARCEELGYLAQEYARVEAATKKMQEAEKKLAVVTPKPEEPKPPTAQETYAEALEAFRAGNDDKALAAAQKVVAALPEANYLLGAIHVRQGLWDDAREELEKYLQAMPKGSSADDARRQLDEIKGKRPLLLDDFTHPPTKWQLADAAPGTAPPTERLSGTSPSDGPCLKVDPGRSAYTSFEQARVATLELKLFDPPDSAGPLPGITIRLYSQGVDTCPPLIIDKRGYHFASQTANPAPHRPGWRRLIIDVAPDMVTAHLDGQLVGEVRREAGFSGLSLRAESRHNASPLYIDDVRVVEPM